MVSGKAAIYVSVISTVEDPLSQTLQYDASSLSSRFPVWQLLYRNVLSSGVPGMASLPFLSHRCGEKRGGY
ncbi:Uncharacterized protein HZ326_18059 [Fusarium oxysporum f. sp. albedinis]|nr:Uncharacterized protein HZ326_18059 [Fusarium oxysporum f. sp. albedinis]